MYWSNFLHFYQPIEQEPDILEKVVVQSYRPILKGIKENKNVRLTLNINGALLELFDRHGYRDIITTLREISKKGRIEFTGSAKYHALLPFLKEDEIIRQIKINKETGKFFLGDFFNPVGFFPPEMAYSEALPSILEELGFKWIILDEISMCGRGGQVDYSKLYKIKGTKMKVFFRERRLSNLVMSAVVRSEESVFEAVKKDNKKNRYVITGMDGETFGHHRPGLEKMLFELFCSKHFDFITVSEIEQHFKETEEVVPVRSTWASSEHDIERGVQFLSWHDPDNIIHKWQWEFTNIVLEEVYSMDKEDPKYKEVRDKTDAALASDHFWWASAKPWWSLEMIEAGAFRLLQIMRLVPGASPNKLDRASKLYEEIVSTAFEWKRSGKIYEIMTGHKERIRVPFKERTLEKGKGEAEIYRAFIDMMREQEKKATEAREYERAILWRDAIYKIEQKQDIYDSVHAVDLLRLEIPNEEIEKILDRYTEEYRKIRGGQPEQRGG